jgi:peptidylprolyl isomerase
MATARMGDTVRVHYEGKLDDGTVFASSIDGDPAEVTIGARMVIPAFEEAIIGMDLGETKTVRIPEEAAFGPRRQELVRTINREGLAAGLEPEVGQRLQAIDAEGRSIHAIVRDISERTVTIDANHPLAGQDLNFEIQLVEIV